MKKALIFWICFLALTSCKEHHKNLSDEEITKGEYSIVETKEKEPFKKDSLVKFTWGSIVIPRGWKEIPSSIAVADFTFRYSYSNRAGNQIELSIGLAPWGIKAENNVLPWQDRWMYLKNGVDTTGLLFSDNPIVELRRKNGPYYFKLETLNGFDAVMYWPKKEKEGFVGIHLDSVGGNPGYRAGLSMYSKDLDKEEEEEFKKVVRSIKFNEKNIQFKYFPSLH